MRHTILLLALLTLVTFFTQSCRDCEPTPSSTNTLKIAFYRYDSLIAFESRVTQSSTFEEVLAVGLDSIFYDDEDTEVTFELPLSNLSNNTFFTFEQSTGNFDTIQVGYFKRAVINGPDCGLYEEYQGINVPQYTFDSVYVLTDNITLEDVIHLEVFY